MHNQAAEAEPAVQNQQRQDLNGIPRFSSMNDLLKNLQDLAEKQGISMDRFKIRPAAPPSPETSTERGQSSSKATPNSNQNTAGISSYEEFIGVSHSSEEGNHGVSSKTDQSLLEKLNDIKRLHQQMAHAIASIENDIRTRDDPSSKVDKGKQKM